MAKNNQILCCKCSNYLEFGGASPGMVAALGGMKAALETVATNTGWSKTADGWQCRKHG